MIKTLVIAVAVFAAAQAAGSPAAAPGTTAQPVLEQQVLPFAPASGSGWTTGCVRLRYDVSAQGVPENIRVLASAPGHLLDRNAVSALSQWRYQPATREGKPVMTQDLERLLVFRAPGNPASPPYGLCGGQASHDQPAAASGAPPPSTARVDLGVTRAAVTQTFRQAPQSAGSMPREGRVSVRFCVNPQGHTKNLRVVRSQPAGVFDQMALMLMRAAVFAPHEVRGYAVTACNITQPIVFEAAAP